MDIGKLSSGAVQYLSANVSLVETSRFMHGTRQAGRSAKLQSAYIHRHHVAEDRTLERLRASPPNASSRRAADMASLRASVSLQR